MSTNAAVWPSEMEQGAAGNAANPTRLARTRNGRRTRECLPPAGERFGQYPVLDASLGWEWLDRNRTGIAGVGFAQEPENLPRLADRKRPRIPEREGLSVRSLYVPAVCRRGSCRNRPRPEWAAKCNLAGPHSDGESPSRWHSGAGPAMVGPASMRM